MKKPVYIIERDLSGDNHEIVATTFEKGLIIKHIEIDMEKWTFPVTYRISKVFPSYSVEQEDADL